MAIEIKKSAVWIIVVLVILNIISIGALWLTQESRSVFEARGPHHEREHRIARRLDLSPEQRSKFDSLNARHRMMTRAKNQTIRDLRSGMLDHLVKGNDDSVKLLAKKIGKMHEKVELMNFNHFQNVYTLCNERQKQKFINIVEGAVGRPHEQMRRRRFKNQN